MSINTTIFVDPDVELSLTELASKVGVAIPTILRDVDRLVAGRYLRSRRQGRSRLISADREHPLFEPLRQIVLFGYGPVAALPGLLAGVDGIEESHVFGSWAARHSGEAGEGPGSRSTRPAPDDVGQRP